MKKVNYNDECVLAAKGADQRLDAKYKEINKSNGLSNTITSLKKKFKENLIDIDKEKPISEKTCTIEDLTKDNAAKIGVNSINKNKVKMLVYGFAGLTAVIFVYGMTKDRSFHKTDEGVEKQEYVATVPEELKLKTGDRIIAASLVNLDSLQSKLEADEIESFKGNDFWGKEKNEMPEELKSSPKKEEKEGKNNTGNRNNSVVNNNRQERTEKQEETEFTDIFADCSIGNKYLINVQNTASANGSNSSDYMSAYTDTIKEQYRTTYDRQNMQDSKKAFMDLQEQGGGSHVLNSFEEPPISEYTIYQGTIIPIILQTGINSDLPGMIVGKVLRDVYNTVNGKHLMIPSGSTVIGAYDSSVSFGQKRVLVAWQRLIRPDGSSVDLKGMQGVDMSGYCGYSDKVDYHYKEIASLMGLTTMMEIGSNGVKSIVNPSSIVSDALTSSAEETSNIVTQAAEKIFNTQPTLTVRPSTIANKNYYYNYAYKHCIHSIRSNNGRSFKLS